jgi:twitching motility protein PilI
VPPPTPRLKNASRSTKPDVIARRTRLREFQAQLLERMQAARNNEDARVNQLGVMIGQEPLSARSAPRSAKLCRSAPVTVVPLTQSLVCGPHQYSGQFDQHY